MAVSTQEAAAGGREPSMQGLPGDLRAAVELVSELNLEEGKTYRIQCSPPEVHFIESDGDLTDAEVKAFIGHTLIHNDLARAEEYWFTVDDGDSRIYFWGTYRVTLSVTEATG